MARKREKRPKAQKLKKVPYRFLPRAEHEAMYELLDALVEAHHEDLSDAKIALLFNNAWQPDVDGNRRLVQSQLVQEFYRELSDDVVGFDLAIVIHEPFWMDETVTPEKRRAVLDHALCYFDARRDKSLEHEVNERGRRIYRMRTEPIKEFPEIIERHGFYLNQLEQLQQVMERARARADSSWPGFQSLRDELAAAGASIPLEIIQTWSEDERREARTWALVRADRVGQVMDSRPPRVVLEALPGGTLLQDVTVAAPTS
jgi:hypothetical protein